MRSPHAAAARAWLSRRAAPPPRPAGRGGHASGMPPPVPRAGAAAPPRHLVRLGLLTTFQATRLLEGQGRGLVLGPYVLLDAVGTGSLGTVYKAAGKADRRAYALKVLPAHGRWNVRQARRRVQAFP